MRTVPLPGFLPLCGPPATLTTNPLRPPFFQAYTFNSTGATSSAGVGRNTSELDVSGPASKWVDRPATAGASAVPVPSPFIHRVNRGVENTTAGASQWLGSNHISDSQRAVTSPDRSAIVSLQPWETSPEGGGERPR